MVQARKDVEQDYTLDELAVICRVHVRTIRRWVHSGHVRAYKLPGGIYRIPQSEVDRIRQPVVAGG